MNTPICLLSVVVDVLTLDLPVDSSMTDGGKFDPSTDDILDNGVADISIDVADIILSSLVLDN